jgi:RsiW-degrading membrane proteinase PrsW (M82 family)
MSERRINVCFFAHINGTNEGPFSADELKNLIKQKRIFRSTYIIQDGSEEWMVAGEMAELFPLPPKLPDLPAIANLPPAPLGSIAIEAGGPSLPPVPIAKPSLQTATDLITEKLGLDRLEGFSLKSFFSEVFGKHDPNEVENLFTVGSILTTPKLQACMAKLPSPWLFFRVLVATIFVYLVFLMSWNMFQNVHVIPGLIIVGSFAVPLSVLILFFEINTPRNVSIVRLIKLVVMGGALSILLSLFLFEVTPFLGIFGASAAGIVEEAGKLATVLFVMRMLPMNRYPYLINALLFGAAVGTGFAAFESAGYALRIGLEDIQLMLDNITLRGVLSPFAHIVWTAIATAAYWRARKTHTTVSSALKSKTFLALFSVPVVLHFVWNMPFDGVFWIKYWVLGFIAWVVIFSLVQTSLKEIKQATEKI